MKNSLTFWTDIKVTRWTQRQPSRATIVLSIHRHQFSNPTKPGQIYLNTKRGHQENLITQIKNVLSKNAYIIKECEINEHGIIIFKYKHLILHFQLSSDRKKITLIT